MSTRIRKIRTISLLIAFTVGCFGANWRTWQRINLRLRIIQALSPVSNIGKGTFCHETLI